MLTIETTIDGDTCIVKLDGRLDVKTAKEADTAFAESAAQAKHVVLDLGGLEYVASAGLRAIKRLRGAVKSNEGTLVVRNVQNEVMEIFEMTGFSAMLTFE